MSRSMDNILTLELSAFGFLKRWFQQPGALLHATTAAVQLPHQLFSDNISRSEILNMSIKKIFVGVSFKLLEFVGLMSDIRFYKLLLNLNKIYMWQKMFSKSSRFFRKTPYMYMDFSQVIGFKCPIIYGYFEYIACFVLN